MTTRASPSVCVIGAGVCGIVSIKACLETGLDVTCYERSAHYGGLWRYRDEKVEANGELVPSVMKSTILNTSKELSAFSDFPPPPHLPNFMKHELYMEYIKSYVLYFKLLPRIKFMHEILQCKPELVPGTGEIKWSVEVRDLRENVTFIRKFDRLMVAIGHHNIPYSPTLPDQHKFKGQILHTSRLKDILNDARVKDKRVAVIGLGNSACDAATDLAVVAKKCYVSCHRGSWFYSRLSPTGLFDFEEKNRWSYYRSKFVPKSFEENRLIRKLNKRNNHQFLGLTPKHKPSEAIPAINDLFPYRVFTGGITLKSALVRFTEEGLIFEGEEDREYKVDVVVLATGYSAKVSFMSEYELGIKSIEHDEYELFLNMFAPRLTINKGDQTSRAAMKSLAFIGLAQPSGSILVISELQARLATQVFAGKSDLPDTKKMLKHIERLRSGRAKAVRSHSKDQLVGNWIGYQDEVSALFNVKPNMRSLFFKDLALWKQLMFGPSIPYQYRLTGPGSWDGARNAIMTVNERVYCGVNEGKNHILFKNRRRCLNDRRESVEKQ